MVEQPVEHGAGGGGIAQQFSPVFDGLIGSQQCARAFVAPHDHFQQILGGTERQFARSEIVEDEQRHAGQRLEVLLARAVHDGPGEFLQQHANFTVQHAVALQNGGMTNGLRQMTFARATWAKKQRAGTCPRADRAPWGLPVLACRISIRAPRQSISSRFR
jgi:hypothetical protein